MTNYQVNENLRFKNSLSASSTNKQSQFFSRGEMVDVKIKNKTNGSVFLKFNFSLVVKIFSAFGPIVQPSGSHIWITANTLQFINFVNLILGLEFISLTMLLDFGDMMAGRVGLMCDNVLDHSREPPLGTNVLLSKCGDRFSQESELNN